MDDLIKEIRERAAQKITQLPLDTTTLTAAINSTAALLKDHYTTTDSAGEIRAFYLNKDTNLISYVAKSQLYVTVGRGFKANGIIIKDKDIKTYVDTWLLTTAPQLAARGLPKSFTLDATEVAFSRIDISKIEPGPTPTWDVFLANCGPNAEALMAYTWSILDTSTTNQQYLFIKGTGMDGKGSYIRWLTNLMGPNAHSALSATNPFWPALCLGKRLGVFNELNSTSLVMKSEFKRITGSDEIEIANKYEKAFSAVLDTKFILTTNMPISISGEDAERRRAIIINMQKKNGSHVVVKNYEEGLRSETWAFLYRCREAFKRAYDPSTFKIEVDYTDFEREASDFEEANEYYFSEAFEVGTEEDFVRANRFQEILLNKLNLKDSIKISSLKVYMAREYGITKVRLRHEDDSREWVYKGIKVKGDSNKVSLSNVKKQK